MYQVNVVSKTSRFESFVRILENKNKQNRFEFSNK